MIEWKWNGRPQWNCFNFSSKLPAIPAGTSWWAVLGHNDLGNKGTTAKKKNCWKKLLTPVHNPRVWGKSDEGLHFGWRVEEGRAEINSVGLCSSFSRRKVGEEEEDWAGTSAGVQHVWAAALRDKAWSSGSSGGAWGTCSSCSTGPGEQGELDAKPALLPTYCSESFLWDWVVPRMAH